MQRSRFFGSPAEAGLPQNDRFRLGLRLLGGRLVYGL